MQPEHATARTLPQPDAASAEHSRQVGEHILKRIAEAGGSISFAEFMQFALYAPGLGYYVAGARKFGAGGDFVTAPELSPLFGRVIARQAAEVLHGIDGGQIFELGAGSGALAATVLERLDRMNALPDRYRILEVSPDLRQRQQQLIEREIPQHAARVEWLAGLPEEFAGVIIANEVADALPVERFRKLDGVTQQARVAAAEHGFRWHFDSAPAMLADAVTEIEESIGRRFPDGYCSEICLALRPWMRDLVACLHTGLIILFDYGVTRQEYYAPDRHDGWLKCHYRHHVHDDPLILPGIQDVTASVDFSALADVADSAGAKIGGFVSQAHFLLNGGLQEEFEDFASRPVKEQFELSRQVKLLTLPGEMGEHVKCIGLSRGAIAVPSAFREYDRIHTL